MIRVDPDCPCPCASGDAFGKCHGRPEPADADPHPPAQDECWLKGYGACRGKLNREHPIPKSILKLFSPGLRDALIGGLKDQPENTLQPKKIKRLVVRLYCEQHNSSLSPLDTTLRKLLTTLNTIDKAGWRVPNVTEFDGPEIERALLKVLVGLTAMNEGRCALKANWRGLLAGSDRWPASWGLYMALPGEPQIIDGHLGLTTLVSSRTLELLGARFHLSGVVMNLLLVRPPDPSAYGHHRNSGYFFHLPEGDWRLHIRWPHNPTAFIDMTSSGNRTPSGSPFAERWRKDPAA